ncbi:MAG: hypothetical protein ACI4I6_04950 [Hominimerdicola sp.]
MRRQDAELVINNNEIYNYYRDRLISMALSQFEWHKLPDTVDPLYMERSLLFQGTASLLQPTGTDMWLSLPYVFNGQFDGYGYPTDIKGIDFNGRQIDTNNFVVIYDNVNARHGGNCNSLLPKIDLYARLMWEAHNTFRANLKHQINPYILTGGKNQRLSFLNIMNRMFGYQPFIQVRNEDELNKIKTLNTNVPYIGNELLLTLKTLWAEALSMLGIASGTTKRERQNEMELTLNRQESAISMDSRLLPRIYAANRFNKLTGMDISVNMVAQDTAFIPYTGDAAMRMVTNDTEKEMI